LDGDGRNAAGNRGWHKTLGESHLSAARTVVQREPVTRLARPRLSSKLVSRRRLIDIVDDGVGHAVTLVCAGAGWGKTVLVASWAAAARSPVAWLTLSGEDNDRTRFWTHVAAALRSAGVVPPGSALAELEPVPRLADAVLLRVLEALDHLVRPVVLVLDDFQELDDRTVTDDLAHLFQYMPEGLRAVVLTRTEPVVPLHRLRAAGDLTEIRTDDLAFRADEAAALLARHDLRVTNDELTALLARTEGWAAGLRLAAAYLTRPGQRNRIDDFAGDRGAVADYLNREVLAALPPDVQGFLLRTSVLGEVCAELATAVTAERYSQRILEDLELANAFVYGLDPHSRWFRYHPLLQDALSKRLHIESPELVAELHVLAAHWYADHGAVIEAIRHAAAARDWDFVASLAANWTPLVLSADRTAFVAVLRKIPPDRFIASPELIVCAALLLYDAGNYDAIPEQLALARHRTNGGAGRAALPIEIALLTLDAGVVCRVHGDMPGLLTATTQVLGRLATVPFDELPALLHYRAIALNNKGVGLLWSGDDLHADRYLWAGSTAARAAGLVLVEINAIGHLALLAAMRGSLREAYEHAVHARDLARRRGAEGTLQVVAAFMALALVELEHDNLAEAERSFQQGFDAHRSDPEATQVLVATMTQARLFMARGDLDSARVVLRRSRREVDPRMAAPAAERWHLLTQSELDLASGHAETVVGRYGRHTSNLLPSEAVCLARAELALGNLDLAEALAARARAASPGNLVAVWAWTVTALVADAQGYGNRSVDALAHAVRIADREGIRRPFLTLGDRRLVALLERQRWLVKENARFVADILADTATLRPVSVNLPDSDLSERELEVLRYLPTVLTAAEIARDLHVSVNTVKAHLRSIYRKLDVSRRREAVVRGRELGAF
jgi:LuxR family transcriptional regulator, maltose regulon positive regulatory protein